MGVSLLLNLPHGDDLRKETRAVRVDEDAGIVDREAGGCGLRAIMSIQNEALGGNFHSPALKEIQRS